ncbi:MAG: hypothetical protein WCP17_03825 [bacterium]
MPISFNNSDLQKLIDILNECSLSDKEKENLILLFSKVSNEDLAPIVKLFSEDKAWIYKINQNYKNKNTALNNKDSELWKKILEDEEFELKKIQA